MPHAVSRKEGGGGGWMESNFVLCEGDSGVITEQKCLGISFGTLYVAWGESFYFKISHCCSDKSEAMAL